MFKILLLVDLNGDLREDEVDSSNQGILVVVIKYLLSIKLT